MLWSQVEWLLSRKGPMQAASASQSMQSVERGALRARHAELGGQLRVAVMEGNEARIRRLLSELLRGQGLSKAQRISVQLKALLSLVQSLRCATVTAELAALTTNPEYASRGALMLRVRRPQQPGSDLPPLSLRVGVAHFNPRRPVGIDELLTIARQSLHEPARATETASSGLTPQPVRRVLNGLEAEDAM